MTGALVPSQAASLTQQRTPEVEALVREQFGLQEANDSEIAYFFAVAERLGLDPVTRQVHAVMRYDNRVKRKKLTVQIGIDGFRAVADRQGNYAGSDAPQFEGETEQGFPVLAQVTTWKIVQGQRVAFVGEARWSEFYPGEQQGAMWRKMPHVMLAKVAEAAALRKGWPAQLGQVYAPEEMQQQEVEAEVSSVLDDDQVGELVGLLVEAGFSENAAAVNARAVKPHKYEEALRRARQLVEEQQASNGDPEDEEPEAA